MTNKYVLTGGPGSGKSTLIKRLSERGFYIIGETAEFTIRIELPKKNPILPWTNMNKFQELVLRTQSIWENEIPKEVEVGIGKYKPVEEVFLDRGIPDGLGYCRVNNIEPQEELLRKAREANYDRVFIIEPLRTLERTAVRRENEEERTKTRTNSKHD